MVDGTASLAANTNAADTQAANTTKSKFTTTTGKTKGSRGTVATGSTTGSGRRKATAKRNNGICSQDNCFFRAMTGIAVCIVILGGVSGILYWQLVMDDDSLVPVSSCGGCHCIVFGSSYSSCPITEKPQTQFDDSLIQSFKSKVPLNQMNLTCGDPFAEENSDTCEKQIDVTMAEDDNAVCALHYQDDKCESYYMITYATREEAIAAGAAVTHTGSCGVCSTTQDLAVYIQYPDLTSRASECGRRALLNYDDGLKCFKMLGFTTPCSRIWTDNTMNTARECGQTCILSDVLGKSLNGPPPSCIINECIECDEAKSGPTFRMYAGRTRRDSGILSAIARSCDEIVDIKHEECPETTKFRM